MLLFSILPPLQNVKTKIYCVLDLLMQEMDINVQIKGKVLADLNLLAEHSFLKTLFEDLKKSVIDLLIKFKVYLEATKLCLKLESYKYHVNLLLSLDLKNTDFITLVSSFEEA